MEDYGEEHKRKNPTKGASMEFVLFGKASITEKETTMHYQERIEALHRQIGLDPIHLLYSGADARAHELEGGLALVYFLDSSETNLERFGYILPLDTTQWDKEYVWGRIKAMIQNPTLNQLAIEISALMAERDLYSPQDDRWLPIALEVARLKYAGGKSPLKEQIDAEIKQALEAI